MATKTSRNTPTVPISTSWAKGSVFPFLPAEGFRHKRRSLRRGYLGKEDERNAASFPRRCKRCGMNHPLAATPEGFLFSRATGDLTGGRSHALGAVNRCNSESLL